MRVPKNPSANWSEKRHRRVLDAIFPTVPGFTGRLEFLTGDPTLTLDVLKAIDEQLVPLLFNLLKFQLHLLSAFRRYEAALRGSTGDDLALVKAFSEHKPLPESPEKSGDAFVGALLDGLLDAFEVDQKHAKVLDMELVDLPAILDCDLFGRS